MLRDLWGRGLRCCVPSPVTAHPFPLTAPSRSILSPGLAWEVLIFQRFHLNLPRCRDHNTSPGPPALGRAPRLSCGTSSSQHQRLQHGGERRSGGPAQFGDQEGQASDQAAPPTPALKGSQLKPLSPGRGQSLLQTPRDGGYQGMGRGYQGMEVPPMVLRNFFPPQSDKQPRLPTPLYPVCRVCSPLQSSPARSSFSRRPELREGLQPLRHPELIYP